MKLYATVTSERASKGQGGNEYLAIVVLDEAKTQRARFDITNDGDGFILDYLDYATGAVMRLKEDKAQPVRRARWPKGEGEETKGAKSRTCFHCSEKTLTVLRYWICQKCKHQNMPNEKRKGDMFEKTGSVSGICDFNACKNKAKRYEETTAFYCPECRDRGVEETQHWTGREIAEKGTPVCPECDSDMVLEEKGKKQKGKD